MLVSFPAASAENPVVSKRTRGPLKTNLRPEHFMGHRGHYYVRALQTHRSHNRRERLHGALLGLLFLSCALTIATQMAKFSAFKYSEAQPLQKYAFLPNCWQFFIDLLVLQNAFTGMQYVGFAILFAIYGGDILLQFLISTKKNQGTTENEDDEYERI